MMPANRRSRKTPWGHCGPSWSASPQELEQAIRDYIDTVNANPRPFRWTKTADDILATIKRFCLRTLDAAERQHELIKASESGH